MASGAAPADAAEAADEEPVAVAVPERAAAEEDEEADSAGEAGPRVGEEVASAECFEAAAASLAFLVSASLVASARIFCSASARAASAEEEEAAEDEFAAAAAAASPA